MFYLNNKIDLSVRKDAERARHGSQHPKEGP